MEYLLSEDGGGAKRFFLLGTDYVYPRTTNKILRAFLHAKGSRQRYRGGLHPVRLQRLPDHRRQYQKFAAGGKTAVVSTINGDSNVPFYKELANRGLKATDVPVVAFSVGKRSCAASIPNRWSATSRHGTTLSPSIIRPTKPSSPIIARMPKRTSCRMPIRW